VYAVQPGVRVTVAVALAKASVPWWVLALRGASALLFGLVALTWPGMTLWVFIVLFAGYVVADGVLAIVAAARAADRRKQWLVLEGVTSIAAGALAVIWPRATLAVLIYLIGGWAIITGAFRLAADVRRGSAIRGERLLLMPGALAVVFGLLLVAVPMIGLRTLMWLVGVVALIVGGLLLGLAAHRWSQQRLVIHRS
jgi:uncharacterized membrane protein HdeD (DUF308 family)